MRSTKIEQTASTKRQRWDIRCNNVAINCLFLHRIINSAPSIPLKVISVSFLVSSVVFSLHRFIDIRFSLLNMVASSFALAAAAAVSLVGAMPTQQYHPDSHGDEVAYQPTPPYPSTTDYRRLREDVQPTGSWQKPHGWNEQYHEGYAHPTGSWKKPHGWNEGYHEGYAQPTGSWPKNGHGHSCNQPGDDGQHRQYQDCQPQLPYPSNTYSAPPNRATHRVLAGSNGLHFEPENIVAEIGDLIEVHFNPANHSFAQSSFDKPCEPIDDDAVFSGFMPTQDKEAPMAFTFEVKDKKPFWFYCSQTNMNHCQSGMAGVINQDFNSNKTLANYKIKAAHTGTSVSPPKPGNGGVIAPPPNGPGL